MLITIVVAIAEAIVIAFLHKVVKKNNEEITDLKCKFLRYKIEFYKSKLEVYSYDDVHGCDEQTGQESREEWRTNDSSTIDGGMCRSDSSSIQLSKKQDGRKLHTHTRGTSRCDKSEDATSTCVE